MFLSDYVNRLQNILKKGDIEVSVLQNCHPNGQSFTDEVFMKITNVEDWSDGCRTDLRETSNDSKIACHPRLLISGNVIV